jgi:hypothetical protein
MSGHITFEREGRTVHKTVLLLAIITFLLLAGKAYSAKEDLVFFDLSLAGYRIGMTYDEATAVRPFHSMSDVESPYVGKTYSEARAEHIYVDDIEMDLWVYFIDDKIQKINGRFHPSAIEDMIGRLHIALGPGENKSREVIYKHGGKNRQVIYRWDFPTSKLFLIGLSSNSEYSTVSIVAKEEENQLEKAKGMRASPICEDK